ncbi:uncharacterized protein LOC103104556 [Monodelphis domestica]|uniref:uncharacterized protein LOC103104556 n=1 Tax=Monodelphis domestica TaxID=13616 RepID=UPI00044348FC|nr:uncharacterized protein LOC103104556 [Monodelphis domestica]
MSPQGRRAGAAVVDHTGQVIWDASLPEGTSAQKDELIALAAALWAAKDKQVTIYTDSRYAFMTLHVHAPIYQEREFVTLAGKSVAHLEDIQDLLTVIWEPCAVAVVHTPGHQSGSSLPAMGNRWADKVAKAAATRDWAHTLVLPIQADPEPPGPSSPILNPPPDPPQYSDSDCQWIKGKEGRLVGSFFQDPAGNLLLPRISGQLLTTYLHHLTHLSANKLHELLWKGRICFQGSRSFLTELVNKCTACQLTWPVNPNLHPGTCLRSTRPCEHWELDFTEVRPGKFGFWYLLVLVDTFTGWPEAFATKTETAHAVTKILLEEIIPRFGVPSSLGSDNGPAFVAKTLQALAGGLGVKWKLHCQWNQPLDPPLPRESCRSAKGYRSLDSHFLSQHSSEAQTPKEGDMTHSLQLLHFFSHLLVSPSLVWLLSILQGGTPGQLWKWTLTPVESPQAAQTVLSNRGPTFSVPSCTLILAEHCEGGGRSTGKTSGMVSLEELKDLALMGHYICPSSNPGRSYCNQPGHYLCAYWDCVTLARDEASHWTVKTDQFLGLKLIPNTGCTWDWFFHSPASKRARCTQLNLTVLRPEDQGWLLGRTWGVRRYESGYDQGGFFTIRKELTTAPVALGPNLILNPNPPAAPLPNNPSPANSLLSTTPQSLEPSTSDHPQIPRP